MDTLFLITARGGSKGIPGKNISLLGKKPLIHYSINMAREFAKDACICVSTDDEQIIATVRETGLEVPFRRPAMLASDTAGSNEVIIHALDHYKAKGKDFRKLVLLQPTSPFRTKENIREAIALYSDQLDMVVSVTKAKTHLFYAEDKEGLLRKTDTANYGRRQDAPDVYELNGAIYVFNVESLRNQAIRDFTRIKKYEMSKLNSVDIDEPLDLAWAEFLIEKKLIQID